MGISVAVVGASGAVGREMADILETRKFPVSEFYPLASERSLGKSVRFGGQEVPIQLLDGFDFSTVRIALFSAGSEVSRRYAPIAGEKGCVVIDNSSCFRNEDDVPLVVPEVNGHAIERFRTRNLIANPNCSTIGMMMALHPVHLAAKIRRINVATYQSASGAGATAIEELERQTRDVLSGIVPEHRKFPARLAFNVIPHIDTFQENGYTREEMKMAWETAKIFEDSEILVNATAVRVPVFYGHAEVINIETERMVTPEEARALLSRAEGVCIVDDHVDGGYPTPAEHAAGKDDVFVGRIRKDITHPNGLNFWVVSDNIRKGAALNAVQIAERLLPLL